MDGSGEWKEVKKAPKAKKQQKQHRRLQQDQNTNRRQRDNNVNNNSNSNTTSQKRDITQNNNNTNKPLRQQNGTTTPTSNTIKSNTSTNANKKQQQQQQQPIVQQEAPKQPQQPEIIFGDFDQEDAAQLQLAATDSVLLEPQLTTPAVPTGKTGIASAPQAPKPKPSSWAAMFKPPGAPETTATPLSISTPTLDSAPAIDITGNGKNAKKKKKGSVEDFAREITKYETDIYGHRALVQPRRLVNTSNSCFLNATLQTLVYCPPFYNLFSLLKNRNIDSEKYPITEKLVQFMREFREQKGSASPNSATSSSSSHSQTINIGSEFSAAFMFSLFNSSKNTSLRQGQQEDAQEFLTFILDGLHEEMLKMTGTQEVTKQNYNDDWEQVGAKGKTHIVQEYSASSSVITDIFGGKLKSTVKKKGSKSSVTYQPFTTLQLDIDAPDVYSIEDALALLSKQETIEDMRDQKTKSEVSASKQITLDKVPKILVLHLKRFTFSEYGPIKISKHTKFEPDLSLKSNILPPSSQMPLNDPRRNFTLLGVVCHHGKEAAGGHYVSYVRFSENVNDDWLRLDDEKVAMVPLEEVLEQQAYLLFYEQNNQTLQQKQQQQGRQLSPHSPQQQQQQQRQQQQHQQQQRPKNQQLKQQQQQQQTLAK